MKNLRRILVPTDFSSSSQVALEHALSLAEAFGAAVHVVHIWEPSPYVSPDALVWLNSEQKSFWEHVRTTCDERLTKAIAAGLKDCEAPGKDKPKVTSEVIAGYITESILAAAKNAPYDLVVMGTHGRTGLSHLVLGSVAERIVRTCPCPVLTVRADEDDKAKADKEGSDQGDEAVFDTPTML